MWLNYKLDVSLLYSVCQVMKLLNRKGQAKMRHWYGVAINSICSCAGIVALDLMADNLMAKQVVVHPASGTPALWATQETAASARVETRWAYHAQALTNGSTTSMTGLHGLLGVLSVW